MRYSGSKGGCSEIARVIQSFLPADGTYHEPFVGAAKVMQHVRCKHRYGSDIDQPIITLLKAVQAGWKPKHLGNLDETDHTEWKERQHEVNPIVAFLGYGCSHGGMFFHKFIKPENNHGKKSDVETWGSLEKQRPRIKDVHFHISDYRDLAWADFPDVIYCDPPYGGTFACGSTKDEFDSDEFWEWAIAMSRVSTVLVSEYDCPYTRAVVVWEKQAQTRQGNNRKRQTKQKVEKLFLLNPDQAHRVGFNVH